jgi:hypothetical protein
LHRRSLRLVETALAKAIERERRVGHFNDEYGGGRVGVPIVAETAADNHPRAGVADYWIVNLGDEDEGPHPASGPGPLVAAPAQRPSSLLMVRVLTPARGWARTAGSALRGTVVVGRGLNTARDPSDQRRSRA